MIAIFFITDRYLKIIALSNYSEKSVYLFSDFLSFTFTPNYYIAFSLPFSGPILNIIIGLMIIGIITYLIYRRQDYNKLLLIAALFILIGAISNFIDRIVCGYVIDYIYLEYFTVFNLADTYISIGSILAIISLNKKPS